VGDGASPRALVHRSAGSVRTRVAAPHGGLLALSAILSVSDTTGTRRGLERAWERSDRIFDLLAESAMLAQPIPLRQPFLFYLGHLPAFAWNSLGRRALGEPALNDSFERLFERGIDPVDVDAYVPVNSWPARQEVEAYRDQVRAALCCVLEDPAFPRSAEQTVRMLLEHELMHQETLLYMLHQLPRDQKRRPAGHPPLPTGGGAGQGRVRVPRGKAILGTARGSIPFGWDNEFPACQVEVSKFEIDTAPVRQSEFLRFVEAGGYEQSCLWEPEGWAWRTRRAIRHPLSWQRTLNGWLCRTLFEEVPLEDVADWPVYVSWAEAAAYARWKAARLPTEAEFHRAAYGSDAPSLRPWPWGAAPPAPERGSFDFNTWSPTPVGSHPAGASEWGVLELVGNGWEWTGSTFAPFEGFERMATYPGYSADFFDGQHFVLLGASWATDAQLIRRSFRNWFQPNYPYVFAKFRCVYPS
jgi:gamma-glutamyl hercynylcysteine S-oxide synthase